jgi:hypothetical protein
LLSLLGVFGSLFSILGGLILLLLTSLLLELGLFLGSLEIVSIGVQVGV